MGHYILKRVLITILIMIVAGALVFTLMYIVPGDPAKILLGSDASSQDLALKRHELGIDRPYLIQIADYLYTTFLKFDFGVSWTYKVPVWDLLSERLPRTLFIGFMALLLNATIGTVLGIFAATHEGKWQDSLTMIIAMVFISAPSFWVALMFIILFAQKLQWLPPFGIGSWKHYVLPIITSSLGGIAINARQGRSAMLEVIRADFVTTARAKGQKEKVIVRKHMLPNAMMPIITGIGGGLAAIVGGSVVIESVFSIPGLGTLLLVGLNKRDQPIVCACVVFFAAFTSVVMLVIDICYAYLDPRIKAQYARGRKKVS